MIDEPRGELLDNASAEQPLLGTTAPSFDTLFE